MLQLFIRMSSKATTNVSMSKKELIKKYDYELTMKQYEINQLNNLCDKLTMEIEDKDTKIEQQNKVIDKLLELLKISNPELLKIYTGELTPWTNNDKEF